MITRTDARCGFSMVEVITTLAVITIVLGIALPRIDFHRTRVRSAAHELATTLIAAQSRAVLDQHDVVLRFDTVAAMAVIHLDADNDGALDAGESTRLMELGDGLRFGLHGSPPMPAGTRAVTFTQLRGGLPSLTFHRNGSASQQGVIYVSSAVSPVPPEHVRAVEVARATGRSVCHRLVAGVWEASC